MSPKLMISAKKAKIAENIEWSGTQISVTQMSIAEVGIQLSIAQRGA